MKNIPKSAHAGTFCCAAVGLLDDRPPESGASSIFSTGSVSSSKRIGCVRFVAFPAAGSGFPPHDPRPHLPFHHTGQGGALFPQLDPEQDALEGVDHGRPEGALDRRVEMDGQPGNRGGSGRTLRFRCRDERFRRSSPDLFPEGGAGSRRDEDAEPEIPVDDGLPCRLLADLPSTPFPDQFQSAIEAKLFFDRPSEETVVEIDEEDPDRRLARRLHDVVLHHRYDEHERQRHHEEKQDAGPVPAELEQLFPDGGEQGRHIPSRFNRADPFP